MASIPIKAVRTTNDAPPRVRRLGEDATQTFLQGTPVDLNAGNVRAWPGTDVSDSIIGIVRDPGSNLTVAATAETLTTGRAVQNQSAADDIPRGAPLNDGKCLVELADPATVFYGQINPTGQSLLASDVGVDYGLTIDTDNFWYVDKTKTLGGGTACVRIVGRDPNEDNLTDANRRGCFFQFLATAAHLL